MMQVLFRTIGAWARRLLLPASLLVLAACAAPPAPPPPPSAYDRAYSAMMGAMADQGVRITDAQQSAGIITGSRGNITVTATVKPRPDGSAEVAFKTRGNIQEDPQLIDRIGTSYNARMGR
jgi:hypothetical protein